MYRNIFILYLLQVNIITERNLSHRLAAEHCVMHRRAVAKRSFKGSQPRKTFKNDGAASGKTFRNL